MTARGPVRHAYSPLEKLGETDGRPLRPAGPEAGQGQLGAVGAVVGLDKPCEKATEYAEDYKKQIKKGKSKLFAHEYADLADMGYHSIYREEYAYAYENAINEEKSEEYARFFADEYASELVDIKRRYGRSEDEEAIDFAIEKVNGRMKAWEYVSEHKLEDTERFSEIYENIHLDTYFADNGMPNGTLEEIDKEILEKALLRYNKL